MRMPIAYLPTQEAQREWFMAMYGLGYRFARINDYEEAWVAWVGTPMRSDEAPYVYVTEGAAIEGRGHRTFDFVFVNSLSHFIRYLRRHERRFTTP